MTIRTKQKNPGKQQTLDCLLLFPPIGFQFVCPELGLPQLVAYLNEHGIKSEASDLNFIFINKFIPQNKKIISDRIKKRLENNSDNHLFSFLNKDDFINLDIPKCLKYFPDLGNFLLNELIGVTAGVYDIRKNIQIIESLDDHIFDLFFTEHIKQTINKSDIVGFSILTADQLISVLYFSKLIKRIHPWKKIIIGGPWCICSRSNLNVFKGIFKLVDFVVTAEGEIPLKKLIKFLKGESHGRELSHIGGLAFLRNNSLIDTGGSPVVDLNTLPVSNFDNFGLSRHSPRNIPVMTTKGCYWGRCKFCHHVFEKDIIRSKSADKVVEEIERLLDRYGPLEFDFADASTPVDLLMEIARKIISKRIKLKWNCLMRAEPRINMEHLRILKRSGCTQLFVGLESADQKFLNKMGKGINLKALDKLLDLAFSVDLNIRLFIMAYPFQSRSEYINTWNYVLERRERIFGAVQFQYFSLGRNTDIFSHCDKFNIKQPSNNKYNISSFSLPYRSVHGLSRDDFLNITFEYSKKIYEMKDNYKIIKRIFYNKNRNYLLIRPPTLEGAAKYSRFYFGYREPVSLLKIGAFLKEKDHRVEMIDCIGNALEDDPSEIHFFKKLKCGNYDKEKIRKDIYRRGLTNEEFNNCLNKVSTPDEIFITSQFTYEYEFIKDIVNICRKRFPTAIISLGGIFATLCPDKARSLQCDVFVGLFHLVDSYETDLTLLNYKPVSAVIKFSRGCPNSCNYCAVSLLEGRKTYFRQMDLVMREIAAKYKRFGIRTFEFWESNLFGTNKNYFERFLSGLIQSKLNLEIHFPEGLQPNFITPGLAKKIKLANIKQICLAFESSDKGFQNKYRRPLGSQQISTAVRNLVNEGVYTPFIKGEAHHQDTGGRKDGYLRNNELKAFLMVGLPQQSKKEIILSIIELWKHGVYVWFTPFTPIPNTEIYKEYESYLRTKELSELHPILWPFANEELSINFLENIFSCNNTNSFYQITNKNIINEFRLELQRYVSEVNISDLNREINFLTKHPQSESSFRIIDFCIKKNQISLENLQKIRDYLFLLKKNKSVFYLYRPIPNCLMEFDSYWYQYQMPKDCRYCLKQDCSKRGVSVQGEGRCKNCKYLNSPCKCCFYDR